MTILVIIEAAIVLVLCAHRQGRNNSHRGRTVLTFGVLAAAFIAVVGYQFVWDRFSHDHDPYLLRRDSCCPLFRCFGHSLCWIWIGHVAFSVSAIRRHRPRHLGQSRP